MNKPEHEMVASLRLQASSQVACANSLREQARMSNAKADILVSSARELESLADKWQVIYEKDDTKKV